MGLVITSEDNGHCAVMSACRQATLEIVYGFKQLADLVTTWDMLAVRRGKPAELLRKLCIAAQLSGDAAADVRRRAQAGSLEVHLACPLQT